MCTCTIIPSPSPYAIRLPNPNPNPYHPSHPNLKPNRTLATPNANARPIYSTYLSGAVSYPHISISIVRLPARRKSTSKSASCCIACAACQCLAILTSATFPPTPPHDTESTHSHFPLGRYRSRCLAARKTLTLSLSLRRVRSWLCRRAILVPVPSIIHRASCIVLILHQVPKISRPLVA